jgi:hypothetical protein
MGAVDPGDPFVGAATVSSPGTQGLIPLMTSDPQADYVMNVAPAASCYKSEQVSPTPCRLVTLPALLKNFTAVRHGKQVLLRWQTLTEQENDGFYIQRLVNDQWLDAGFVASAALNGNSSEKLHYQFVTDLSFSGTTHFRIRMQGLDHSIYYSAIRMVQAETEKVLFSIYPNPVSAGHADLFFAGDGVHSVLLYDVAGRLVQQHQKIMDASLPLTGLKAGIYLVKASDAAGTVQWQKLVVQ